MAFDDVASDGAAWRGDDAALMADFLLAPVRDNPFLRMTAMPPATAGEGFGAGFSTPGMGSLYVRQEEIDRYERAAGLRKDEAAPASPPIAETDAGPIFGMEGRRRGPKTPKFAPETLEESRTKVLSKEELEERYKDLGLKFDGPMSEGAARVLADVKKAELIRKDVMARLGTGGSVAAFGGGLVSMLTDPLEVATAFIPILGPATRAGMAARMGVMRGRIAAGVIEGGVGAAVTEPVYGMMSRSLQLDYKMTDALLNIGFGALLGGAFGAGGGALAARTERRAARAEADALADAARREAARREAGAAEFDRLAAERQRLDAVSRAAPELDRMAAEAEAAIARSVEEARAARVTREASAEFERAEWDRSSPNFVMMRPRPDVTEVMTAVSQMAQGRRVDMDGLDFDLREPRTAEEIRAAADAEFDRLANERRLNAANEELARVDAEMAPAKAQLEQASREQQIARDAAEEFERLGWAPDGPNAVMRPAADAPRRPSLPDQFRWMDGDAPTTYRDRMEAVSAKVSDPAGDFSGDAAASRAADAVEDFDPMTADDDHLMAMIAEMRDNGTLPKGAEEALAEAETFSKQAKALANAANAGAACMAR